MLSFVEPCVGIVCACLPTMRPLLIAIKGPASEMFSIPSNSAWSSLRLGANPRSSITGIQEKSTSFTLAEPIRAAISAKIPVGEGPLFTTRVHGGYNTRWELRDEEQAFDGCRITSILEQSADKR